MRLMRRPFRERNPIAVGLAGMTAMGLAVLLAMNLGNLPVIGGDTTYSAAFAEASGLKPGEEVRLAGVKVGQVDSVDLEGSHVRVEFSVDGDTQFGTKSRAEIKIKTLLGSHYLALVPDGPGQQPPEEQIPESRTAVPFEITPALSGLTRKVEKIDSKQLAKSFDVLSNTFENSPEEVKSSLRGLRRLSATIASRDQQLTKLLGHAKGVSGVIAERDKELTKIVADSNRILREVRLRRNLIHQLLVNTVAVSQQVSGLIKENKDELRPALKNLQKVTDVLVKNRQNLDQTLQQFVPMVSQFADATGSGPWIDGYLQNFVPLPLSVQLGGGGPRGSGQNGTGSTQNPGEGTPSQAPQTPGQSPGGQSSNPDSSMFPFLE